MIAIYSVTIMSPTQTANGQYDYEPLHVYITTSHRTLSEKSGWTYQELRPGTFGYDSMAVSIGYMLEHYQPNKPIDYYANLVHIGWCINYIYWRDYRPEVKYPELYTGPFNPLGDERRNTCAKTDFKDLPFEEQQKDIIVAESVVDMIHKKCV